ncbi:glycosyltransferase family 4 protein [Thalassospira sp.]|uniref:glycosyltransferase family 4 protein n=1 Tax=Thalassospira sp. TaxID=1912094 RepID=UPI000C651D9C|nr:glycosyltransferase family 4 protein [Thalassospira sp.]MBC07609.1 hypothetical protein [Thalassospira sp.]|tara:strand:- start:20802 stop:21929 length:1128 start_codon:yes stop_codon:yes gene_type:complete
MKVLIWHWGRRGGGPKYTLELSKELAKIDQLELHLSLSRQSELYSKFSDVSAFGRFDISTYNSVFGFVAGLIRLPWIKYKFFKYLKDNDIDIVVCTMDHLWNWSIVGAFAKFHVKYVLVVHDANRHPGEDQLWRRLLLDYDIRKSDGAIVLTSSVGNSLQEQFSYPKNRIFRSVHGHFGEYIRDTPRILPVERRPRILFFGRVLPYKGLDLLLKAFRGLKEAVPKVELEIWGGGDLGPYLEDIAKLKDIKLVNRWIDEAEILGIFERCDILVLPYREASQSGVVGLAMAYGMPVVVTPIAGLREQVKHEINGVITSSVDAESLTKGLERLLLSADFYTQISQGGLNTACNDLSWKNIALGVFEDLKSVAVQGRRN